MHSGVVLCEAGASEGPGDSGLEMSLATSSRRSTAVVKGAPQISHVDKEG